MALLILFLLLPCAHPQVLPRIKRAGYTAIQLMAIQVCRQGRELLWNGLSTQACAAGRRGVCVAAWFHRDYLTIQVGGRICMTAQCDMQTHTLPAQLPEQEHAYYGSFGYHVTNVSQSY